MRTQGIELSLSTTNIETKELSWSSSLTLSLMNQKITRLRNTPNALDMVAGRGRGNLVGYPKGSLFSYNFQGLNSHGLPTFDFGLYPTIMVRMPTSTVQTSVTRSTPRATSPITGLSSLRSSVGYRTPCATVSGISPSSSRRRRAIRSDSTPPLTPPSLTSMSSRENTAIVG